MCVFCEIVAGTAEASVVHEDAGCLAFMALRPIHPGAFIAIPRAHIDYFTDLPDDLSAHLMVTAQRLGRAMMAVFAPLRVGYVVHGFGVPHAHLNVVPQHDTCDIISARHVVADGPWRVSEAAVVAPPRADLDAAAARIRAHL